MDYKEKLRLAKEALDSGSYDKETIEYIFPELKNDWDEEIRKALIKSFEEYLKQGGVAWGKDVKFKYVKVTDAIAWLEKQVEQKLLFSDSRQRDHWEYIEEFKIRYGHYPKDADEIGVIVSEIVKKQGEQKDILEDAILDSNKDGLIADTIRHKKELVTCPICGTKIENQSAQKPWCEEDEERYLSCLKILSTGNIEQPETINTVWLKSLKERLQSKQVWKPSRKQLKDLAFIADQNKGNTVGETMISLYKDLVKLTE